MENSPQKGAVRGGEISGTPEPFSPLHNKNEEDF